MSEGEGFLLALDLDGTYVRGNTLHIYIRCGLRDMWRRRRIVPLAKCMLLLAARKLHLVSHRKMKFDIFGLIEPTKELQEDFEERVWKRESPEILELVTEYHDKGYCVLLATAAPAQYVPLIWGADYVATDMDERTNPGRVECRGEEKLRRVEEYASARGLRLKAAITDDAKDDAPLLGAAEERILVKYHS
ncbi:MAG: haloacid dehalogenase-like hydrolase [Muribaculaceae bacterium]|nr:haloacid dehalogenase-like hydrolase [Muribaculaceae bacterium]